MIAQRLFDDGRLWDRVTKFDSRAAALADRHYSRQTVGAGQFLASGRTLVLLTPDLKAVWGVCENLDPAGNRRWRCAIFRNEGPAQSSALILEATGTTYAYWRRRYGGLPGVPLQTEVDPSKTRPKRDPGRCFRRAGWFEIDRRRGLVILQAPPEVAP